MQGMPPGHLALLTGGDGTTGSYGTPPIEGHSFKPGRLTDILRNRVRQNEGTTESFKEYLSNMRLSQRNN